MYPQGELNALHGTKVALRQRIAVRRFRLATEATRSTRPLHWLDRALTRWHSLAPLTRLAAVPLGLWLTRAAGRAGLRAGRLLRWGSLLAGLMRAVI